jgi:hypothetical protein
MYMLNYQINHSLNEVLFLLRLAVKRMNILEGLFVIFESKPRQKIILTINSSNLITLFYHFLKLKHQVINYDYL